MSNLGPDYILYASGRSIYICAVANISAPIFAIELGSEIHALTAHGASTVVAATSLGLVTLKVPNRLEAATYYENQ